MAEEAGTSPGSVFALAAEELPDPQPGRRGGRRAGERRFTAGTPAALLEAAGPLLERLRGRSPG